MKSCARINDQLGKVLLMHGEVVEGDEVVQMRRIACMHCYAANACSQQRRSSADEARALTHLGLMALVGACAGPNMEPDPIAAAEVARSNLERALTLADQVGDTPQAVRAASALGQAFEVLAMHSMALSAFERAAQLSALLSDAVPPSCERFIGSAAKHKAQGNVGSALADIKVAFKLLQ